MFEEENSWHVEYAKNWTIDFEWLLEMEKELESEKEMLKFLN